MENFCVLYIQRAACSTFHTCILNSHYGHIMRGSIVDIQSATAEIRRGKKRRKKKEETGQKHNIRIGHKNHILRRLETVTGQLADTPTRGLPTRGLDDSRTGHLADWSTRGCHHRLCVLSFRSFGSMLHRELSSYPRDKVRVSRFYHWKNTLHFHIKQRECCADKA